MMPIPEINCGPVPDLLLWAVFILGGTVAVMGGMFVKCKQAHLEDLQGAVAHARQHIGGGK